MRLGVLDVGSNTVHFLVVDAYQGARPTPVFSHKAELHLNEHLVAGNRLSAGGERQLRAFVVDALQIAEDKGVEELLAFATSAIRNAANGDEVIGRIRDETQAHIQVLPGSDDPADVPGRPALVRLVVGEGADARHRRGLAGDRLGCGRGARRGDLTAARRGQAHPRLVHRRPAAPAEVRQLRKHVRTEIARRAGEVMRDGQPDRAVATSKTFRQLARIAGAAPSSEGFYARRVVSHNDVTELAERLAAMTAQERAGLPGVSHGRAPQLAAGAIVADAAMDLFSLTELEICPWALREGVILRRLDALPS